MFRTAFNTAEHPELSGSADAMSSYESNLVGMVVQSESLLNLLSIALRTAVDIVPSEMDSAGFRVMIAESCNTLIGRLAEFIDSTDPEMFYRGYVAFMGKTIQEHDVLYFAQLSSDYPELVAMQAHGLLWAQHDPIKLSVLTLWLQGQVLRKINRDHLDPRQHLVCPIYEELIGANSFSNYLLANLGFDFLPDHLALSRFITERTPTCVFYESQVRELVDAGSSDALIEFLRNQIGRINILLSDIATINDLIAEANVAAVAHFDLPGGGEGAPAAE